MEYLYRIGGFTTEELQEMAEDGRIADIQSTDSDFPLQHVIVANSSQGFWLQWLAKTRNEAASAVGSNVRRYSVMFIGV